MMVPWLLCALLFAAALVLGIKYMLLRKAVNEIRVGMEECLSWDTNTLIPISPGDRAAARLASSLNGQLKVLREMRQQYQSGNRELKEAITNISHDLRTPITAIRGYMDLLEREAPAGKARRYLSIIEDRVEALRQLTEELFGYSVAVSRPDPAEYVSVSLNSALEDCVAAHYAALLERGIAPEIQMPKTHVMRALDPSALSRVLGNIMSNAMKYSEGDLQIALNEAGEITFSNTASGLDEIQAQMLFDRFYTVNAARNSTGLGLAISRTLVERMNGRITAEYAQGKLRIRVALPASNQSQMPVGISSKH